MMMSIITATEIENFMFKSVYDIDIDVLDKATHYSECVDAVGRVSL